jgi:ADYC domain
MSCRRPNARVWAVLLQTAVWMLTLTATDRALAIAAVPPHWARDAVPPVADECDPESGLSGGVSSVAYAATGVRALSIDGAYAVRVAGTTFEIAGPDGHVLPQDALVGVEISVDDGVGGRAEIRIDAVVPDPQDTDGDVTLYALSVQDGDASWRNLCTPGPDGLALGFPVSGTWTSRGVHERSAGAFSITCTSGTIGKCVRMGYKYWRTEANGAPMWALHQACTRMLRADYCGDGQPHTRDGTVVNVYDRFGIQRPDAAPASHEATWDENSARCVERTRVPDVATLEEITRSCPERLAAHSGRTCADEAPFADPLALLANAS